MFKLGMNDHKLTTNSCIVKLLRQFWDMLGHFLGRWTWYYTDRLTYSLNCRQTQPVAPKWDVQHIKFDPNMMLWHIVEKVGDISRLAGTFSGTFILKLSVWQTQTVGPKWDVQPMSIMTNLQLIHVLWNFWDSFETCWDILWDFWPDITLTA